MNTILSIYLHDLLIVNLNDNYLDYCTAVGI